MQTMWWFIGTLLVVEHFVRSIFGAAVLALCHGQLVPCNTT